MMHSGDGLLNVLMLSSKSRKHLYHLKYKLTTTQSCQIKWQQMPRHTEMELLFHTYILIETKTQQHSPQARTMSTSERNYAQLKKEAFSLVYSVQHLHRYLYGMCFTLVTDHKLLTMILSPFKDIPSLAAVRLQQWAIILSAYQYQIECKCTNDDGNADRLSRLPISY